MISQQSTITPITTVAKVTQTTMVTGTCENRFQSVSLPCILQELTCMFFRITSAHVCIGCRCASFVVFWKWTWQTYTYDVCHRHTLGIQFIPVISLPTPQKNQPNPFRVGPGTHGDCQWISTHQRFAARVQESYAWCRLWRCSRLVGPEREWWRGHTHVFLV